jgi:uncharacterized OB-fold protein
MPKPPPIQELVDDAPKKKEKKSGSQAPQPIIEGQTVEGVRCNTCGVIFPSRNACFKHIKATGHALRLV